VDTHKQNTKRLNAEEKVEAGAHGEKEREGESERAINIKVNLSEGLNLNRNKPNRTELN